MKGKLRIQLIIAVPIVMLALSFISCDDADQARRSGMTTITGSVEGPFLVSIPTPKKPTFLTKIKKLLTIIKPAGAQGDDIEIEASQNGVPVDSSFVVNGMYTVEVPAGGPVKLDFITPDETFSVEINVTPSSEVVLDVDLELSPDGPVVDIQRFDITSPSIVTRDDERFSFTEPVANLTVEGGGEDCIRSTGISLDPNKINVEITVDELNLNGCRRCVFADGNQSVALRTESNFKLTVFGDSGDISCVASDDAIRAEEASSVKLQNQNLQGGIAILSSGANGIAASGIDTVVDIEPGARGCSINAAGETIVEEDGAVVNADCGTELGPESELPGPPLGGAVGGCGSSNPDKGGEVISKQKFGFGKYVFDVTPVPPDAQGMVNGFFLLDAKCDGAQGCPPFFVDWADNQREIDIEFVPGWSMLSETRPVISTGSDCSADNTNCNVRLITSPVARPQNFVSFNTFANNSAGQTRASNHQAFYETSSSPFGARNKYTIYYTPCGIQWSVASERGDAPILYQNSAHIDDNQNQNTPPGLRNFIHTVDFDQLKAAPDLHIYINYYGPTDHHGFSGGETPPDRTKSFVHSVEFFPIDGDSGCSSVPVANDACTIDSNNKITCKYKDTPSFKSDFENGVFELNGNAVQSWEDLWIRALFDCWPIFTCPSHTRYNGKGNPLELCFRRSDGACDASPGCDF